METQVYTSENEAESQACEASAGRCTLMRALTYGAAIVVTAGMAYAVFRALAARRPADPTKERIQALIEEANRLLKELDETRSS